MANFPTYSKNFQDILLREGKPLPANNISFTGVIPSSRTSFGSYTGFGYGNGVYITSIVISVNSVIPVGVQVIISEASDGDLFERSTQALRNKILNNTVTIPINEYFRDFPTYTCYMESGDGVTTGKIDVNVNGVVITDSLNYDANNLVLWVGDSITEMSGLPQNNYAKKYELHTHMINNYLISKGKDTRISIQAKGGTTSTNGESARLRGFFDAPGKAQYYFYHFGMNDCTTSDPTNYVLNIGKFITWALYKNPSAKIIILGISPAENSTTNTNAIVLRAAANSYVSGLNLSNVFYCELGNAFDRTNSSFYSSADAAGSRVHPNIAGMAAIYNVISSFLYSNNIA
jgi:lysophospholipase L1-like esterase